MEADITVSAVADPRWEQIRQENRDDPYFSNTRYYEDADKLLEKEEPDGVFIGTRCSMHTPIGL